MTAGINKKLVLFFISATLVVLTLIAYEPIRHNGFVGYDDDPYIVKNPEIKAGITWQSLGWAFTHPHYHMWHPLTTLSHMTDCRLFGLNPFYHHLVSVLLHAANALLLFWILANMTGAKWSSAFVAAVFALHPVQVESVAWAAERKTVLSGLLWLLTIAVYIHYTRRPVPSRYVLLLLVFGLCIMTKPVVVTLPLVLLLLDYWPLDRVRWGHQAKGTKPGEPNRKSVGWLITEKIPLLAMSAFLSAMTLIMQKEGGVIPTLTRMPLDYRAANMFISYMKYIGKMIWPSGLAACYPHPRTAISDYPAVICAMLFILLTVVSIYIGRRRRYAAVGWLWYAGTLVPVIGLVQSGAQAMANRYMYIPMVGLLIIIVWAVKDIVANNRRLQIVASVSAAVVLSLALALTRTQAGHWQNSITLFEYTLKVTKNNALAENNYGSTLLDAGRLDEAIPHLNNALRLVPTMTAARNNLGKVFLRQKKSGEAIACYNNLLQQNEDTAEVRYSLAMALIMQKKYNDAIQHLARALDKDPDYPDARNRMGIALLATGRANEAIACFDKLLQQNKGSVEVHYHLAIAFIIQKKYDDAIKQLGSVLSMDPNFPNAHDRMGAALVAMGRMNEAIGHLNEALQTSPDKGDVYINLGTAYIQLGNNEAAIQNLTKAIELKSNNISTLNNLAWLLATTGDISAQDANRAIELARRACELTVYKEPVFMDTLAAAYAAGGRFEDAVRTAQQAIDAAKASGREDSAGEIENRMELYKTGQRYRQK